MAEERYERVIILYQINVYATRTYKYKLCDLWSLDNPCD